MLRAGVSLVIGATHLIGILETQTASSDTTVKSEKNGVGCGLWKLVMTIYEDIHL